MSLGVKSDALPRFQAMSERRHLDQQYGLLPIRALHHFTLAGPKPRGMMSINLELALPDRANTRRAGPLFHEHSEHWAAVLRLLSAHNHSLLPHDLHCE